MKRVGLNWQTLTTLAASVNRGDRSLGISITRSDSMPVMWHVVAIETARQSRDMAATERIDRVFNDHGHAQLDPCHSLPKAIEVAEKYARWWRSSGATTEACDCEDIAEP